MGDSRPMAGSVQESLERLIYQKQKSYERLA